jgi:hypothetical protein
MNKNNLKKYTIYNVNNILNKYGYNININKRNNNPFTFKFKNYHNKYYQIISLYKNI